MVHAPIMNLKAIISPTLLFAEVRIMLPERIFELIFLTVVLTWIILYFLKGRPRKHLISLGVFLAVFSIGLTACSKVSYFWITQEPHLKLARMMTPERAFDEVDLLIEEDSLPVNWVFGELSNSVRSYYVSLARNVYPLDYFDDPDTPPRIGGFPPMLAYEPKIGFYEIFHYLSSLEAQQRYNSLKTIRLREHNFGDLVPGDSQARITTELEFSSQSADRWRLTCISKKYRVYSPSIRLQHQTRCYYLAQYDEFLIVLDMPSKWDGITLLSEEEFTKLVQSIDQQMNWYFSP